MEKKKLLLVAVSVGVFLVIVVSAAILIFRSGSDTVPVSQVSSPAPAFNRPADPLEVARDNASRGLLNPNDSSSIQDNNIGNEGSSAGTVISVPKPATAAVPAVASTPRPAAPRQTAPAAAPAKPAASSGKAQRDYWVQAGSFSTRERADGVKSTLGTKGITAIVTNQDINGNTYYRVRIGPYTSQNEADYWLAMVKSIDGFQDSQIWESQSFR